MTTPTTTPPRRTSRRLIRLALIRSAASTIDAASSTQIAGLAMICWTDFGLALQGFEIFRRHVLAAGKDFDEGFALFLAGRHIAEAEIALADHAKGAAVPIHHWRAADMKPQHDFRRRAHGIFRADSGDRRGHAIADALLGKGGMDIQHGTSQFHIGPVFSRRA